MLIDEPEIKRIKCLYKISKRNVHLTNKKKWITKTPTTIKSLKSVRISQNRHHARYRRPSKLITMASLSIQGIQSCWKILSETIRVLLFLFSFTRCSASLFFSLSTKRALTVERVETRDISSGRKERGDIVSTIEWTLTIHARELQKHNQKNRTSASTLPSVPQINRPIHYMLFSLPSWYVSQSVRFSLYAAKRFHYKATS